MEPTDEVSFDRVQAETVPSSTRQALELPLLLEVVAALAATDLGRDVVRRLEPYTDRGRLLAVRRRFAEVERLLGDGGLVPSFEGSLVELLARLLDPISMAVGMDLLRLADLLEIHDRVAERVRRKDPELSYPELSGWIGSVPSAEPLVRQIRSIFDRRGQVREDASPLLDKLGRQVRRQRDGLYRQFQSLIGKYKEHLSEETLPLRDGRLVMMLQSGARGRIPGLVHARSGSGKSFYFEPFETVESNNQLQHTVGELDAERQRILREILDQVLAERETIERHLDFVAELDRLQACARFAELSRSRLAELGADRDLRLIEGRHPLLIPELAEVRNRALGQPGHTGEVVPLDLELDELCGVLVITGPNAGGKTVALKTVGLLVLANQCGLPVPVEAGTRLPFLGACVATVGDEQDLLADRSTFSGRLMRLETAWRLAQPDSLVLLDELGSGTDPAEGAALSVALLERLLMGGGLAIITTHLTQLAVVALERDGAGCAAMEFEAESGEPTFRLLPGPPGGSEALALARRLGLPSEWIDRADELLGEEQVELRRVLREAEALRAKLTKTELELRSEQARLDRDRRELEQQSDLLEENRRGLKAKLRAELEQFREQTRRDLDAELERLRTEFEAGRRRGLTRAATERLFAELPETLEAPEEAVGVAIELGGRVRHNGLGWEGVLEKLDRGKAEVSVAGKKFRCKTSELTGVAAPGGSKPPPAQAATPSLPVLAAEPEELLLLGMRVEEALEAVDRCLDRALVNGQDQVRVVHGHGTGRLKRAVREFLHRHRAVASSRPGKREEGGDGATVATLA